MPIARRFGIRLEIPEGALSDEKGEHNGGKGGGVRCAEDTLGSHHQATSSTLVPSTELKVAVRTVAPACVSYLSEVVDLPSAFPFSPLVHVSYPAGAEEQGAGGEAAAVATARARGSVLGGEVAHPYSRPLLLTMPHCFDPADAGTEIIMLGAPHGAAQWERLDIVQHSGHLEDVAVRLSAQSGRFKKGLLRSYHLARAHTRTPVSTKFVARLLRDAVYLQAPSLS